MAVNDLPSRARLVSNVVEAQIMENHGIPIIILQLLCDVPRHVAIDFSEILTHLLVIGSRPYENMTWSRNATARPR